VGYFTRNDTESGPGLAPLTFERVEAVLKQQGFHFFIDSDGDLGGNWDDHMFYFFFLGKDKEILQVRGQWNRRPGPERLPDVLAAANNWNTHKIFPKIYVHADDGVVRVFGEHSVDYEHGVSDEQILLHIQCAINTTVSFFETLEEESA
jgi:hypothetical protein